jgi:hypothetical protein
MNRQRLADLTSGVGALVLGIGLGALFGRWLQAAAPAITAVGFFLHAFGMWDKHRLESAQTTERSTVVIVLYWFCWLLLAALVIFFLI